MIDHGTLEAKFHRIGARLKLRARPDRPRSVGGGPVTLDVRSDGDGEFFEIRSPRAGANVEVLDVQSGDRHLLVLVREGSAKHKFLCGHDERHWFVAAVPESAPVGTVRAAKEALKPADVQAAQARAGLPARDRNRRKNAVFRRQGEWFFLPVPAGWSINEMYVLRNEPISRGRGSKPHWAEFCYRVGGQTLYVCSRYPQGLDAGRYQRLLEKDPQAKTWGWRAMQRVAEVYVRGRISHADHKTITLPGWHRVLMNTEHQARAMRNVAFLD
jgi:hypothetical protein